MSEARILAPDAKKPRRREPAGPSREETPKEGSPCEGQAITGGAHGRPGNLGHGGFGVRSIIILSSRASILLTPREVLRSSAAISAIF